MIPKEQASTVWENEPSNKSEDPPRQELTETLRVDREDNRVFCVVTRHDGVEVRERIPVYIVDKWSADKQEWYLKSVAMRLKTKLRRMPRNGKANSLKASGDIAPTGDPSGPAA